MGGKYVSDISLATLGADRTCVLAHDANAAGGSDTALKNMTAQRSIRASHQINDSTENYQQFLCVAITFLEESTFSVLEAADQNTWSVSGSTSSDTAGGDVLGGTADVRHGGCAFTGTLFPAGTTIYGQWTKATISAGSCVCYLKECNIPY
jgi:hypothetical protein